MIARTAPRPRRALGPVAGTVVAVVAWLAVAHSSGAGWVQALGALLTGILVVGLVGPALAVRRARCAVVAAPADAVAGQPVELTVAASSAMVVRPLDPPGRDVPTGGPGEVRMTVVPRHRGVLDRCEVRLASAAPFGLLWWTVRATVSLPRPLHVAPPVADTAASRRSGPEARGYGERPVPARVGEPRGARPYRPGDLRSWVHWPATAHTGDLMVREMEQPAAPPVTVHGILPDDPEAADAEASQVLGAVARNLAGGRRVVLVTAEPSGTVAEPVASVVDAGRRMARALP
ncbi:MAG: DUF58 domain-containing protein, partial [Acidimicrobiales bacterium]